jgi:hypothetical protein
MSAARDKMREIVSPFARALCEALSGEPLPLSSSSVLYVVEAHMRGSQAYEWRRRLLEMHAETHGGLVPMTLLRADALVGILPMEKALVVFHEGAAELYQGPRPGRLMLAAASDRRGLFVGDIVQDLIERDLLAACAEAQHP